MTIPYFAAALLALCPCASMAVQRAGSKQGLRRRLQRSEDNLDRVLSPSSGHKATMAEKLATVEDDWRFQVELMAACEKGDVNDEHCPSIPGMFQEACVAVSKKFVSTSHGHPLKIRNFMKGLCGDKAIAGDVWLHSTCETMAGALSDTKQKSDHYGSPLDPALSDMCRGMWGGMLRKSMAQAAAADSAHHVGKEVRVETAGISQRCAIHANVDVECGFPGITKAQCEAKGCCYNPSSGNKWCYPPAKPVAHQAAAKTATASKNAIVKGPKKPRFPAVNKATLKKRKRKSAAMVNVQDGTDELDRANEVLAAEAATKPAILSAVSTRASVSHTAAEATEGTKDDDADSDKESDESEDGSEEDGSDEQDDSSNDDDEEQDSSDKDADAN